MMATKCGFQDGELQANLQQYFTGHVNADLPEDGMAFFSQGARFAVSREQIQRRSREEYMQLLSVVSGSADPCANYMNEWLWYYIMGKQQQRPCPIDDIDLEAPISAAVRFLSGVSGVSGTTTTPAPTTVTTTVVTTTAAPAGTTSKTDEVDAAPARF